MRIQHNITAMNSYRNYGNNTSSLSKNLEKLSSGYKINRAGDDAAGLAISEKMRAQITGLEVASKNAKDGISLVQTAEGALTEVHDMLNRMVTLAEQSANGTYSDDVDRDQLQKEVNQLRTEIDRIAESANFNKINLLDGTMQEKDVTKIVDGNFQDMSLTSANIIATGALAGAEAQKAQYAIDTSNWKISFTTTGDVAAGATVAIKIGSTILGTYTTKKGDTEVDWASVKWAKMKDTAIDGVSYTVGYEDGKITLTAEKAKTQGATLTVSFTAAAGLVAKSNQGNDVAVETVVEGVTAGAGKKYAQASISLTSTDITDGFQLKLGGESYTFAVGKDSAFKDAENAIDLTSYEAGDTDIEKVAVRALSAAAIGNETFKVSSDQTNAIVYLTERDGAIDYTVNDLTKSADDDVPKAWEGLIQTAQATTVTEKSGGLVLQIGDSADDFNKLKVSIQDMHAKSLGLDGIDISTQAGATAAMAKIQEAINKVSDVRGDLGATQNRLDHTINNLGVMRENIQNAESTIRDTDVAEEMMAYTKNSILNQAAQAMLAQANQLPQGVLQLLQ